MKALAIIATVLVTGCASNAPINVMWADEATVKSQTDLDLCRSYALMIGKTRDNSIVGQELQRRLQSEWSTIKARHIQIGMSEAALVCSWGRPDRINTSTGSWGTKKQWVYGTGQYVYTSNGRITSWQQSR